MPLTAKQLAALDRFCAENNVATVGSLGTALVLTRKAEKLGLPMDVKTVATAGGGQVSGLSGSAINKILVEHGVTQQVGTESGRTSRGTINLGNAYANLLNEFVTIQSLKDVERFWIKKFVELFNTQPFELKYDQSKTIAVTLQGLVQQAIERQRRAPGTTCVGALLQHLVGAKLELALPKVAIVHNGFSVADSVTSRSGDFVLDEVAIHCTTSPSLQLLAKCRKNLESGVRPIILTLPKSLQTAMNYADEMEIGNRVEILDAIQFLTANLYEMSHFRADRRKVTLDALVSKYNEIISRVESDPSLRIAVH